MVTGGPLGEALLRVKNRSDFRIPRNIASMQNSLRRPLLALDHLTWSLKNGKVAFSASFRALRTEVPMTRYSNNFDLAPQAFGLSSE